MRISLTRKAHFNAAHKLYVQHWSEEKNLQVFGKCANPHYHGHNYAMEVTVTGETDPETGMLMNLKTLKEIIRELIEDRFDHKNLNEEISEFESDPPTAENLCYLIWKILREALPDNLDLHIFLWETPRNGVQYPPVS